MTVARDKPVFCQQCGYDIRAQNRTDVCPECSYPVESSMSMRDIRSPLRPRDVVVLASVSVALVVSGRTAHAHYGDGLGLTAIAIILALLVGTLVYIRHNG